MERGSKWCRNSWCSRNQLYYDKFLKNKDDNEGFLKLTIDLSVQSIVEKVLAGGINVMNSKGGSSVLIDVNNGEIISLVSFPEFDPNHRPIALKNHDPTKSPLFNRAAQGLYELGSTFKVFLLHKL